MATFYCPPNFTVCCYGLWSTWDTNTQPVGILAVNHGYIVLSVQGIPMKHHKAVGAYGNSLNTAHKTTFFQ